MIKRGRPRSSGFGERAEIKALRFLCVATASHGAVPGLFRHLFLNWRARANVT